MYFLVIGIYVIGLFFKKTYLWIITATALHSKVLVEYVVLVWYYVFSMINDDIGKTIFDLHTVISCKPCHFWVIKHIVKLISHDLKKIHTIAKYEYIHFKYYESSLLGPLRSAYL